MKDITITSAQMLGTDSATELKHRGNRVTRVPEIIEVSMHVFATLGNAGFTQRKVASDAGIRLSTLQHYFGTREDLLRATLKAMADRYIELFRALAKDKLLSPEARLDAIMDETFAGIMAPDARTAAFALEHWSLAEREDFARKLSAEITAEFQDIFAGLVAKINPALTSGECALRGALLVSQLQGLLVFLRRAGDNAPDPNAFLAAAKVVWKALSKAPQ
ncbi:TetR/AcrR family transcriptional regulator [Paraburkholderia sp. 40]|uniref:TetR/AcrR family transcriptional regulator n=1 Tax=unclassified Paraburkholderia TaxID=2615204 RepID=UPI003D1C69AC